MPQTATANKSVTIGGRTYSGLTYPEGTSVLTVGIDVPAAVAGTLTTRTTSSAGVITSVAHGLTTADKPDLYWNTTADGAGVRRQITITGVTADTFTFTTGAGDNLPVVSSSVTFMVAAITDVADLLGDAVTALGADAGVSGGTVYFLTGGAGTSATETVLVSEGASPAVVTYDGTGTNPLAGATVTAFQASQPGLTAVTAYVTLLMDLS